MNTLPGPSAIRSMQIEIASTHGVDPHGLCGSRRDAGTVAARHEFWRQLRERNWSFKRIAEFTGHSHTSVMSALGARRTGMRPITAQVQEETYALITEMAAASKQTLGQVLHELILAGLATKSRGQGDTARIIRLHQAGEFDTVDIGRIVGRPESDVSNTISAWREMRRAAQ